MQDVIKDLEALFAQGILDASDNYQAVKNGAEVKENTTTDSGAKYKNKTARENAQDQITAEYQANVDDILNNKKNIDGALIAGYTPDVYQSLGMPSLPFVIGAGHVYSVAKTEAEARSENKFQRNTNYHGMGETAVKNIYSSLQDPIMIIAAKDVSPSVSPLRSTHSVVAIVDVGKGNTSLLLPVEITAERTVNGTQMDVNVLSSAYERNVSSLVWEAIAQENSGDIGVYYAKKEALTLPSTGVQFPKHLQQSIASNGIVHQFSEKVNMKISDVTQSKQFKRWFGDWQNDPANASKVVNDDGTPKIMYHGSEAQFTVFDKTKAKSSGLYGRGFYFTDSKSHAEQYGETYSVYLDIKNPLMPDNDTVSRKQVSRYLEAVAENEDYSIENYGSYNVDEALNAVMGTQKTADAFSVIQNISATAIGDMVEATELFNKINGTQFDGIIVPTETVAFRPNQIKSATDNIGTFDKNNPDIRYKMRGNPNVERVNRVLEKENAKLKEDVADLRAMLKLQRQVTNGTKFTKTSVEAAAKMLKKNMDAKGSTKELSGLLNTFYEYIASTKELSWEDVVEQAKPAAQWLLDNEKRTVDDSYARDILRELHGSKMYLDEQQRQEAAHQFGSYDAFRKKDGECAFYKAGIAQRSMKELSSLLHTHATFLCQSGTLTGK